MTDDEDIDEPETDTMHVHKLNPAGDCVGQYCYANRDYLERKQKPTEWTEPVHSPDSAADEAERLLAGWTSADGSTSTTVATVAQAYALIGCCRALAENARMTQRVGKRIDAVLDQLSEIENQMRN